MENAGTILHQIRKNKGLTLKELADESLSISLIAQFEKNQTKISYDRFFQLLDKLEVSYAEFNKMLQGDHKTAMQQLMDSYIEIMRIPTKLSEIPPNLVILSQLTNDLEQQLHHNYSLRYSHYLQFMKMINHTWFLRSNHPDFGLIEVQSELKTFCQPIVYYLLGVDSWGIYELTLLCKFAVGIEHDLLWRLTQQAVKRAEKFSDLKGNNELTYQVLATVFSVFASIKRADTAKKVLQIWEQYLQKRASTTFALSLPFYQGWLALVENKPKKADELSNQSIYAYRQCKLEKEATELQDFWKSIKESFSHQSYMVIIHTTF